MMTSVDHLLEGVDLTSIHTIFSLIGALLAAYTMQLTSHLDIGDPWILRWLRRGMLAGLSLAMLWTVSYSATKQWQPWPPDLAVIIAISGMLLLRIVTVHMAMMRRGDRWPRHNPVSIPKEGARY